MKLEEMRSGEIILAKTPAKAMSIRDEETLFGHTKLVCSAAQFLTETLAEPMRCSLLCTEEDIVAWDSAVWTAAWLHDLGKANDHFQSMLRDISFRQGVRHETLSLFIIAAELRTWLEPVFTKLPQWAQCAIFFSVSGHHLKHPDEHIDDRPGTSVTLLLDSPDFRGVLEFGSAELGLGVAPQLSRQNISLLRNGDLRKAIKMLRRDLDHDFSEREKALIAATKATVMSADLAGSALSAQSKDPLAWARPRLLNFLKASELEKVVETKLHGRSPKAFQLRVRDSSCRTTVVEAGCGTGKTAAAYLWAARHADGRRLFFCYPTTGTASEGFAGYLRDPDFDAILIHSRAAVDYRLLENMPARGHEENELHTARLEALETWPIPAVVCTAHTVLGMLENVRRGLYAWPSIAQSVFVFDEVHAFSSRLFSYLLRFLKAFPGLPVLLMTATLPPSRKQALEEVARERGGVQFIAGPAEREAAQRYRVHVANYEQAWIQAQQAIDERGKILWICNTVGRTMRIVDEAEKRCLPVQPYHSRYRYRDRLRRQRAVIEGFAPCKPPILAVTTQVAEMSLDLSADLLVSEWAPVPSMIQRMGRLNRFAETPDSLGTALFIEPEDQLPYDREQMSNAKIWVERIADGEPKSQADLTNVFVEIMTADCGTFQPVEHCEFLDGLWRSLKDQRAIEEAGLSIEVIREEDLGTSHPAELAIPMPIPSWIDWKSFRREGRYLVAPSGTLAYDSFRGATWLRNTR